MMAPARMEPAPFCAIQYGRYPIMIAPQHQSFNGLDRILEDRVTPLPV